MRKIVFAVSCTFLIGINLTHCHQCTVSRVIDGDTIECAEFIRHIRLEGIDTPEVGDQHGLIVKEVLETFILGKEVTFRYNHCDHYGRIVGTVYEGGDNINKAMLRCIYVKPFRWKDQSRNQQCEIE